MIANIKDTYRYNLTRYFAEKLEIKLLNVYIHLRLANNTKL